MKMNKKLKRMNYKIITYLIGTFLFFNLAQAQVFKETKSYTRSFNANTATTVEVINKYGSIFVSTWNKDSVRINISFKISEKNENRFKKIKENIDFKLAKDQNRITAQTIFGSKYSSLIKDIAEATNYLSSNDDQSKIEYKIWIPEYVNLSIDNKYGDIILPSLKGNVNINLSNGNLQAKDIDGKTELNLAFSDADLHNLRQLNSSLNFVHLNINKIGSMTLNSRSSEIRAAEIETLRLNSRRDNIIIQSSNSIFGEGYFSKLSLNRIIKECQLKVTYGTLSKIKLDQKFNTLVLDSRNCDINLALLTPIEYNALIKAPNSKLELPIMLKPAIENYQSKIETEPVQFTYKQKLSTTKMKINISGADLKISHE